MKYYNYDPDTGRYLGNADADLSEADMLLDPPQEVWLKPAHSTFDEPPVFGDKQMAVFDRETETWAVVVVPEPEVVPVDPLDFEAQRTHVMRVIDAQVDAVIRAVVGDRTTEYLTAEFEANDYAQRGYTGDVPLSVEDQVAATGATPREAADEILAAANKWRAAQAQLRRTRLIAKADARRAVDVTELTYVVIRWEEQLSAISAGLGG